MGLVPLPSLSKSTKLISIRKLTAALGLAIAVLLGSTGISASADYEKVSAAYKRGDYETALRVWKPLAEQGNVRAQFNLGVLYRDGQGVPKNKDRALPTSRLAMPTSDATPSSLKGDEISKNSPSETAA